MKRKLLLLLFFVIFGNCILYSQSTEMVRSFGRCLQLWAQTEDISYRIEMSNRICDNSKFRITQTVAIMDRLLSTDYTQPELKSYKLDTFLNLLDKNFTNLEIQLSDVKGISESDIDGHVPSGYSFVVARVKTNGKISTDENNLFYIDNKNSKIVKIDNFTRNPNNKIRVDFSDLEYDASLGATYNYSKHFPYGGSLIYSYRKFMCSLDLGFTTDGSEIITRKVDMKNIMNYTLTETTFKPKFFATITPSIFLKYFSVGCGVGVLYFSGKEDIQKKAFDEETMSEPSMTVTITQKTSFSIFGDDARKAKLMIRPNARGFVKLSDRWHLILSASYNYVFDYTELNGISFGMGLKYSFD